MTTEFQKAVAKEVIRIIKKRFGDVAVFDVPKAERNKTGINKSAGWPRVFIDSVEAPPGSRDIMVYFAEEAVGVCDCHRADFYTAKIEYANPELVELTLTKISEILDKHRAWYRGRQKAKKIT